jgi:multidrug resistance efflux pump
LYGNIDIREAYLAFNDSEHLDEILVQEGDHVHKGQLLATLHKARMQAQYAAAEAKVASRKAIVARLEAGSRPEEIRQARADVAAAKARLHDAKLTYERNRKLHQKEAVSRQIVDDAQATLDTTRADLNVVEEALALAIEGPRSEDIEEARAMLRVDEAQLALAAPCSWMTRRSGYTRQVSVISGVLMPSPTPAMSCISISCLPKPWGNAWTHASNEQQAHHFCPREEPETTPGTTSASLMAHLAGRDKTE